MDDGTQLFLLMLMEEDEAYHAQEEAREAQLAAALMIIRAEAARIFRIYQRHRSRNYLCRPQLPPNPRVGTAWQALFRSRNDRAFITTMGFDVDTFELIITAGFGRRWLEQPIRRNDASTTGNSRPHGRSLDAWGALGLVLHFLNSTMHEKTLQQVFAIVPTTASRYINFALHILLQTLQELPEASIRWPKTSEECQNHNNLITSRHPRLLGAFASIDGLNLPTQTSNDPDVENSTYNGWLSEHYISSVIVFSPEGLILGANFNAPGSWHDSRVAQPIYKKLKEETPDGFYLVADTAFPRGTQDIEGRIMAPIKTGQRFRGTVEEIEERFAFDRELLSYRQTAEWGMRSIQGSFGRLRLPLPIEDTELRANLLETCFRLHNLRTRKVGRNQIQSVYEAEWRKTNVDEAIWSDFETLTFGKQRDNDRVSHFHVHAVYED
ncbi:hypothetical protein HYPSUDRAFT_1079676 [Hypholoma sublateritium FD-334 SS-4]|uniref:DDE Tnp4 domain-containing protein n=1 Tax=Hypholoma sublateritium (strain FD-334 SS-4) TaxID=945553 RepID=A0A0D2NXW5_HYPSF|nr:hypothetical protein HYPSUDRAFT_1079676 [Hypholoma sublateritium FD-334 SS-4]